MGQKPANEPQTGRPRPLIKICGLKTPDAVTAALEGGADFIGFVFHPASPRFIEPDIAAYLASYVPEHTKICGLFVDAPEAAIVDILSNVRLDYIQLHGRETPEQAARLREKTGKPVIKALPVAAKADLEQAALWAPRPMAGSGGGGGQDGHMKIGAPQSGFLHERVAQDGATQDGFGRDGHAQQSPAQEWPGQDQDGPDQERPAQERPPQDRPGQERAGQDGPDQGGGRAFRRGDSRRHPKAGLMDIPPDTLLHTLSAMPFDMPAERLFASPAAAARSTSRAAADWLLFDAPGGGGTGKAFDWTWLSGFSSPLPWMLAGGLTPENVGSAIRAANPSCVDVSSGVESARGIKDPAKIRAFIKAVREAAA
ncbi:MAG: phosphoribosylanthranilate isomerase [Micavibrio sp.]